MTSKRAKRDFPASLKKAAIAAAHASGAVLQKHFGRKLRVSEKPGAGLVTNADVEAENAALRILKRLTPGMDFVTEESALTGSDRLRGGGGSGRWIIDPLDGTTNFVHRFPMFCVSVGAEWNGELVVGVIYHPILGDTYVGVKGEGATVNGKRIQVSQTRRIQDALLSTGFTARKDVSLHQEMVAFERLSETSRAVRRPGSAALDLAYTARGVFDGFWERRLSAWDVAAGAVLVREAGGLVTDFQGNPFHIDMHEILACTPALNDAIRQNMKADLTKPTQPLMI